MAHDPKVRAFVRRYYVFDRFTLEQSAQKAGVSFNTARRWKLEAEKQGDDWDKVRDAQLLASGEVKELSQSLLTGFVIQYRTTMEELQNDELSSKEKVMLLSTLADSFTKMTAASKRILPEISAIAAAMKTIELFASLLKTKKPHLLPDFLELLDEIEPLLQKEFK
ncbi:DUF1804 family protein [Ursidibacter arcticus]